MGKIGIKIGNDQTGNVLNKYIEKKPIQKVEINQLARIESLNANAILNNIDENHIKTGTLTDD